MRGREELHLGLGLSEVDSSYLNLPRAVPIEGALIGLRSKR